MFQDYFKGSEWLGFPLVALVFFFTFFVAVMVRVVFGMRDRSEMEHIASLPLTDGNTCKIREDKLHG